MSLLRITWSLTCIFIPFFLVYPFLPSASLLSPSLPHPSSFPGSFYLHPLLIPLLPAVILLEIFVGSHFNAYSNLCLVLGTLECFTNPSLPAYTEIMNTLFAVGIVFEWQIQRTNISEKFHYVTIPVPERQELSLFFTPIRLGYTFSASTAHFPFAFRDYFVIHITIL